MAEDDDEDLGTDPTAAFEAQLQDAIESRSAELALAADMPTANG